MKRHRVPGVLDIYEVSDPKEIEAVNNDPRIDRQFASQTCPLNWLFVKRSLSALSFAGKRFPTMNPRGSVERKSAQDELWNRLNLKLQELKSGPEELEPLAQWVRGQGAEESLGLLAQQILGRLFSGTFVATAESWDAALTLVKAPRSDNVAQLLWWRISGKLGRAKRQLASMVNENLSAVNAIGIAVHNLVKSLRRMKALYSDPNRRSTLSPADAAKECLVAPVSVFRQATVAGELNGITFSSNSLFILNIGEAAKTKGAEGLVFMSGSWSSCPGEQWVPAMLEGVWLRAAAHDSARPPA
ncbi:MAG TPA: hypothetical protein VEN79_01040 [Terriglobia bacterium]|nr:hypothetical protein [Terriglobia bacterium]